MISSYKATLLIEKWYQGFSIQRMSDDICIELPVEVIRAFFLSRMESGAIPRTGIN